VAVCLLRLWSCSGAPCCWRYARRLRRFCRHAAALRAPSVHAGQRSTQHARRMQVTAQLQWQLHAHRQQLQELETGGGRVRGVVGSRNVRETSQDRYEGHGSTYQQCIWNLIRTHCQ
jgi:hypothetical protein